MTIAVMQILSSDTDTHILSVVAEDDRVEYVLPSGSTDEILNSKRAAKFAPVFEEEYGRAPESSEDWAITGAYNMGYSIVNGPVENSYKTFDSAIKGERRSIDDAIDASRTRREERRTWTDEKLDMSSSSIFAYVDPKSDEIAYVTLVTPVGGSDLEVYRENGKWTDAPEKEPDIDAIEDMNIVLVSSDYLRKFDSGDLSSKTAKTYEVEEMEQ